MIYNIEKYDIMVISVLLCIGVKIMGKVENILLEIVQNEDELKRFLEQKTIDDVYNFILKKDETIGKEEFDETITEMFDNYFGKESKEIKEEDLGLISGGTGNFGKKATSAVLSLLMVFPGFIPSASALEEGDMSGSTQSRYRWVQNIQDSARDVKNYVVDLSERGYKGLNSWLSKHPVYARLIGSAAAVVLVCAVAVIVKNKVCANPSLSAEQEPESAQPDLALDGAPAPAPAPVVDGASVAPAPAPAPVVDGASVAPAPAPADGASVAPAPAPADGASVAPAPAPVVDGASHSLVDELKERISEGKSSASEDKKPSLVGYRDNLRGKFKQVEYKDEFGNVTVIDVPLNFDEFLDKYKELSDPKVPHDKNDEIALLVFEGLEDKCARFAIESCKSERKNKSLNDLLADELSWRIGQYVHYSDDERDDEWDDEWDDDVPPKVISEAPAAGGAPKVTSGSPAAGGAPKVTGGAPAAGGASKVTSGAPAAGGASKVTSGAPAAGGASKVTSGAPAAGGAPKVTSGAPAAGGTPKVTGGAPAAGGAPKVTGGAPAAGGAPKVTSGAPAAGGTPKVTGGAPAAGGTPKVTGGAPAAGETPTAVDYSSEIISRDREESRSTVSSLVGSRGGSHSDGEGKDRKDKRGRKGNKGKKHRGRGRFEKPEERGESKGGHGEDSERSVTTESLRRSARMFDELIPTKTESDRSGRAKGGHGKDSERSTPTTIKDLGRSTRMFDKLIPTETESDGSVADDEGDKLAKRERKDKEEAEKTEKERKDKEEAEKAEKERKDKEEAEKAEKERKDKEEAKEAERRRKAEEEAKEAERRRKVEEEAEKAERERKAKEEKKAKKAAKRKRKVEEEERAKKEAEEEERAKKEAEEKRRAEEEAEKAREAEEKRRTREGRKAKKAAERKRKVEEEERAKKEAEEETKAAETEIEMDPGQSVIKIPGGGLVSISNDGGGSLTSTVVSPTGTHISSADGTTGKVGVPEVPARPDLPAESKSTSGDETRKKKHHEKGRGEGRGKGHHKKDRGKGHGEGK